MTFHKVETSSNFVFSAAESRQLVVTDYGSNVFRLRSTSARWSAGSHSFAQLTPDSFASQASTASLQIDQQVQIGQICLSDTSTTTSIILQSVEGRGFGVCGQKWLFSFPYRAADRFYGMGEKNIGFELSQKRTQFWNTDVFADFAWDSIENGSTDPMYASFPVLIMKTAGKWLGVLIDNPFAVFMNTGANEGIFQPGAGPFIPELFFGARDGQPDVWFLLADRPDQLIQRIQTLQGRTPLPPLWALGHQQCRWGYKSYQDLSRIADGYAAHQIPNDGLWLDIDYMDGFRVFTVDEQHFSDLVAQLRQLNERGHRVVPILDPGLRKDPAYQVYAAAKAQDILCQTIEGQEFVGYVWPGYTVFPDFSLPEARAFWAQQVAQFTQLGFGGYWIDMNDPSTGSVPLDDMRFARGQLPHEAWHNQYALGMAVATRDGLLAAKPHERPFVVSRSAFLSSARHTALWTGDNMSNQHHMKGTIALSLNLSVSGMPFNGPDVPGFALSASAELMRAWYKLGFLFPFLRNHKIAGQADQEPWTRDALTTQVVASYIRLRYKLLPYLYQLFLQQAERGDPILRPVWYHDSDAAFDYVDDMFFVGPTILQAPFVDLTLAQRTVLLPRHANGTRWYDVLKGTWVNSGTSLEYSNEDHSTPIFLASPAFIPMQLGLRTNNKNRLDEIDVLLLIAEGETVLDHYQFDDGISDAWEAGAYSKFALHAHCIDGHVTLKITPEHQGLGTWSIRCLVLSPDPVHTMTINSAVSACVEEVLPFAGAEIALRASQRVLIEAPSLTEPSSC